MRFSAGLDIGTTGCKIAVYDENANLCQTYYEEYDVVRSGGQHEIDFAVVKSGVMRLLARATSEYHIDALGVTSFGETFALLDENDNILCRSMLYTDPRGEDERLSLCEVIGEEKLTKLTVVKPHSMYSIYKIMWLARHNDNFKKAKRILLGEDFIVYTLTGVAQIDYSLAARTGAFDVVKKTWIDEVFDKAEIDMAMMSKPVLAGTIAGDITDSVMTELNIDYKFAVVNGCHDQVVGMIGSGVFDCGSAMDGTGTVECIPVVMDNLPTDVQFYDCGYSVVPYLDGKFACYALSYTGGATLKWFRDNFFESESEKALREGKNAYALLDSSVKTEPSEILVLPHFAGACTPYMDMESKAAFVGITLETTKFDIYKALMEGTSYEMRLNFELLEKASGKIHEIRATGGGATSDVWLQIKADVSGISLTALGCKEIGAAGTAALAGCAIGIYDNLESTVGKMANVRKVYEPNADRHEIYNKLYKSYCGLYDAVKGLR